MKLLRTVVIDKPLKTVFDYLSDFTTTTDWDPGTVITVREHGNGGVGTTYLNTSRFLGRTTQLTYVVEELADQQLIQLRGENKTVTAIDTIPSGRWRPGTEVTYTAEFIFRGVSRFLAPRSSPLSSASATRRKLACARRSVGSDRDSARVGQSDRQVYRAPAPASPRGAAEA